MGKKNPEVAATVFAPMTMMDVIACVREIGSLQRKIESIESRLNDGVATLQAQAATEIGLLRNMLEMNALAVYDYAEEHRDELAVDGKKTVETGTGTLSWRMTPPAVHIRNADKVVAALQELGLRRFIRVKREPDKEAMLKDSDAAAKVPGVKIAQDEIFTIRPTDLSVQVEATRGRKIKIAKAA